MEKILVLNAGSSTVKFQLFNDATEEVVASGVVDRIGLDGSYVEIKVDGQKTKKEQNIQKHKDGILLFLDMLVENGALSSFEEIIKVGHRVVQGGEIFKESALIEDKELEQIKDLASLAPLHNIPNASGIDVIREILPNVKNIAVFDTEFHQTMPEESFLYGVPMSWYRDYGVRRYGAHGTSHKYVSNKTAEIRNVDVKDQNVIVCHLGNGASLSAVKGGVCIQTSMGLTPLDGVIMGTRCGTLDPSIISYMCEQTNKDAKEIVHELNHESGMKGLTEVSSDFRDIEEAIKAGNKQAEIAMDVYVTRIVEYIGSYFFRLGGADAIVFTAGIGENARIVREKIAKRLEFLGINFDEKANQNNETFISSKDSKVDLMIVSTDEEYQILMETKKF